MTRNAHELGFLEFIEGRQAARVRELLQGSEKHRAKLYNMMNHALCLNPRYAYHIAPKDQTVPAIMSQLISLGAEEEAYLIGQDADGTESALKTLLEENLGYGTGFFISCLPGRLGYYEYEDAGQRYILKKT